jgi:hypothetical protein
MPYRPLSRGGVYVGPCEECGATAWTEPSLRQKIGHWLRFGGPPSAAGPRTCGNCGNQILGLGYGPRMLSARMGSGRPAARFTGPVRVLLAPVHLIQSLRQARIMIPSPWIYIASGLVGVALGLVLQNALEVPWWLVTAGAVFLAWLLFLASALKNMGHVASAFLHRTTPDRAVRLHQNRIDDALRKTDFPLYGLAAAWSGPRFVGGHGTDGRNDSRWALAHGDPYDERSPNVRVEVSRPEYGFHLTAREIFEEFQHLIRRPPQGLPLDEFHDWVTRNDREIRQAADPDWRPITIPLDGLPTSFSSISADEHWVAWAGLGEYRIVIHATRMPFEAVALVRITDVEPYIDGGRLLRERQHPPGTG